MPAVTYLDRFEKQKYSSVRDKELNELFQEVLKKSTKEMYVKERIITYRHWFKEKYKDTLYTLYLSLGDTPEVQVFNFPSQDKSSSMCYGVTKRLLMTYFYGILNGITDGGNK